MAVYIKTYVGLQCTLKALRTCFLQDWLSQVFFAVFSLGQILQMFGTSMLTGHQLVEYWELDLTFSSTFQFTFRYFSPFDLMIHECALNNQHIQNFLKAFPLITLSFFSFVQWFLKPQNAQTKFLYTEASNSVDGLNSCLYVFMLLFECGII